MNKCKECKYWDVYEYNDSNYNTCTNPINRRDFIFDSEPEVPNGVLIENDQWGWVVGPEFGCVNWMSWV